MTAAEERVIRAAIASVRASEHGCSSYLIDLELTNAVRDLEGVGSSQGRHHETANAAQTWAPAASDFVDEPKTE